MRRRFKIFGIHSNGTICVLMPYTEAPRLMGDYGVFVSYDEALNALESAYQFKILGLQNYNRGYIEDVWRSGINEAFIQEVLKP